MTGCSRPANRCVVTLGFPSGDRGQVLARGVPDGPDEDFEKLRWTLLGRSRLPVLRPDRHPYFLPDPAVVSP